MSKLSKEDIAILVGIQDKEWETNTSELREHINDNRNDVPDVDLSGINYRINRKFNVNRSPDELAWIKTEDGGETETGANAPKKIIAQDEQAIREALENNSEKFEDDYDSLNIRMDKVDERSQKNGKQINEIENRVSKVEDHVEKAIVASVAITGGSKKDINKIKEVIDEDSDTTLKDIL